MAAFIPAYNRVTITQSLTQFFNITCTSTEPREGKEIHFEIHGNHINPPIIYAASGVWRPEYDPNNHLAKIMTCAKQILNRAFSSPPRPNETRHFVCATITPGDGSPRADILVLRQVAYENAEDPALPRIAFYSEVYRESPVLKDREDGFLFAPCCFDDDEIEEEMEHRAQQGRQGQARREPA